MPLGPVLRRVAEGESLSTEEMTAAIDSVMRGETTDIQVAALLTALHAKGETPEEIAGAAISLRKHMQRIESSRTGLLDTCGTGGDGSGTFNISTAAALVTAAAGVPVAKHGNRAATSRSGSADVLVELGVRIDAEPETVTACLDELGICFCFAPLAHQSMKNVAAVRRELGFRTIFNLVGPLANPAQAEYQLIGVGAAKLRSKLAQALAVMGCGRAVVVHGCDGLDEVTLSGPTEVSIVEHDSVSGMQWTPEDIDIPEQPGADLHADSPQASAAVIRHVLSGQPGAARDIVVVNAAAALWTAGAADSLRDAAQMAAAAIDDRRAAELLDKLAKRSRE